MKILLKLGRRGLEPPFLAESAPKADASTISPPARIGLKLY